MCITSPTNSSNWLRRFQTTWQCLWTASRGWPEMRNKYLSNRVHDPPKRHDRPLFLFTAARFFKTPMLVCFFSNRGFRVYVSFVAKFSYWCSRLGTPLILVTIRYQRSYDHRITYCLLLWSWNHHLRCLFHTQHQVGDKSSNISRNIKKAFNQTRTSINKGLV